MTEETYQKAFLKEKKAIEGYSFTDLCKTADAECELLLFAIKRIKRSLHRQGKSKQYIAEIMAKIRDIYTTRLTAGIE